MINEELTKALIGLLAILVGKDAFWEWLKGRRLTKRDKLMLATGRDRLIYLAKKYLRQGYIPSDEYDMFVDLGESYLAMGGNHYGEKKFNEAKSLPTIDEDEIFPTKFPIQPGKTGTKEEL